MIKRRNLLQALGASGLLFYLPWHARAGGPGYTGNFVLHVHARGGWDPTLLCDGKLTSAGYQNNLVTQVTTANGIKVPSALSGVKASPYYQHSGSVHWPLDSALTFFQEHGARFTAINGVDTETILHGGGIQQMVCGHIAKPFPALAAMFAATAASTSSLPVAFLGGGVYNVTGGLVSVSRLGGAVKSAIEPFQVDDNDMDLLTASEQKRLAGARKARLQTLQDATTSGREARTLQAYSGAIAASPQLQGIKAALDNTSNLFKSPAAVTNDCAQYPEGSQAKKDCTAAYNAAVQKSKDDAFAAWQTSSKFPVAAETSPFFADHARRGVMFAELEQILQSFALGMSAAANYESGIDDENPTFDSHSAHDVYQQHAMGSLIARLRYILARAQALGILDRLFLVVSSDFGRTPKYNGGKGKDHWPISSVLVAGPGIQGGRTLVGSDDALQAMFAREDDPDVSQSLSLAQIAAQAPGQLAEAKQNGWVLIDGKRYTRVKTSHVHRALRGKLGINPGYSADYPLPDDTVPLLDLLGA